MGSFYTFNWLSGHFLSRRNGLAQRSASVDDSLVVLFNFIVAGTGFDPGRLPRCGGSLCILPDIASLHVNGGRGSDGFEPQR